MSNDWIKVEEVEFEKIPFIAGISFEYYKKNMRKSSSRKEYYSHIIICNCFDKETLVEYWNDIVHDIAVTIQSNLQDMIQAVNIYCCFFVSESVDEKTKQVIENDSYSSKKYIFDNHIECGIDEKLSVIDRKIFSLNEMETIEVFDSEEPFFKGENGGFYQSIYYKYKDKKSTEKKQILVKAVESFTELLSTNQDIDDIYKLEEEPKNLLMGSEDSQCGKFYKLHSVTLNNYRSYKGEATYDFLLNDEIPADFILIYSTNGIGKTSFFDGVEWALTGRINRLDDAVKENDYKGKVLKNLDSQEDDAAYVEMKFAEDKKLWRTVKEYKYSDYGNGTVKGYSKGDPSSKAYGLGRDIVTNYKKWDDFILPHHKIDGVLSAHSAEERYNKWGAYFDPNNCIREQFKYLNSLWKTSEELLSKAKEEKVEAEAAKEKLSDEKESFATFCGLIKEYREINQGFLSEYTLDGMDLNNYSKIMKKINDKKVALCSSLIRWNEVPNYLNNLIDVKKPEYEKESALLDKLKESYSLISKKVNALVEKNTLQINKTRLEENIKQEKEYAEWLEQCKKENILFKITRYEQLFKDKKSNETLLSSIKKIIDEKEEELRIAKNNENRITEHSDLNEIRENILICIRQIERLNIELKNNKGFDVQSSINVLEEEINNHVELVKEKELEKIQKSVSEESINILLENNPENQTFMELGNLQRKIRRYEKQYSEYRKILDEQQKENQIKSKVINEVLNLVKLNEDKICPVCHKEFKTNDDLIEEILREKNIENKEHSLRMLEISKCIEDFNKDKDRIIQEYNEFIEKECSKIRLDIERMRAKLLELRSEKKKVEEYENVIKEKIVINQTKCLKEYKFSEPYSIIHLEDWIKEKKKIIQDEIFLLQQTNNKLTKEIEVQRETYTKINGLVASISIKLNDYENNLDFLAKQARMKKSNITTDIALHEAYELSKSRNQDFKISLKQTVEKLASMEDRMVNKLADLRDDMLQIEGQMKNSQEKVSLLKSDIVLLLGRISRVDAEFSYLELPKKGELIEYRSVTENKLATIKNEISFLERMQNDEKVRKYIESAESIIEQSKRAGEKFDKYKIVNTILEDKYQKTRKDLNYQLNIYFRRIKANDIYNRLLPHKVYTQISFQVDIPDGGNPGLYVTAVDGDRYENGKKSEVVPEWFFSTGQLNALGFCIFLGRALSSQYKHMSTILIDDPLEHMDGINIIGFIDLIRSILDTTDYQIILSTHDYTEYQIVRRKLPKEYYKSKYINIIEDVY